MTAKGVATVAYDGKLDAAEKERALQDAKVNALDRYIATQADGAKSLNYETARTELVASIDRYVLAATVLSEETDTKAKRYTVAIRAEVNAPSVENALVGQLGRGTGAGGSEVTDDVRFRCTAAGFGAGL